MFSSQRVPWSFCLTFLRRRGHLFEILLDRLFGTFEREITLFFAFFGAKTADLGRFVLTFLVLCSNVDTLMVPFESDIQGQRCQRC